MALGGTCEPLSVGPSAQTSKKAVSNHAGGGTPAHFLRSARPAEAAIAKVFAKICQKDFILQIFRTRRTLGDVENYVLS